MKLVWVVNSVRAIQQSAALGLLLSAAWSLYRTLDRVENFLIVTNEQDGFRREDEKEVRQILDLWIERFCIPATSHQDFINDVCLLQNVNAGAISNVWDSITSVTATRYNSDDRTFFIFNNSYPSKLVQEVAMASEFNTVFLSMAPLKVLDGRFNIFSHAQVDSLIRMQFDKNIQRLIPMRYPYFMRGRSRRQPRKDATSRIIVGTTGENILVRLHPKDFRQVIFPILNRFSTVNWLLIGVTEKQINGLVAHNTDISEMLANFVDAGRIILHSEVSGDFFDFLSESIDILYKGSHAGGATTVAACINSGIPVVDMSFADSRAFLRGRLSGTSREDCRQLLIRLLTDKSFRSSFTREQSAALEENNSKSWHQELCTALQETAGKEIEFDHRNPTGLVN